MKINIFTGKIYLDDFGKYLTYCIDYCIKKHPKMEEFKQLKEYLLSSSFNTYSDAASELFHDCQIKEELIPILTINDIVNANCFEGNCEDSNILIKALLFDPCNVQFIYLYKEHIDVGCIEYNFMVCHKDFTLETIQKNYNVFNK